MILQIKSMTDFIVLDAKTNYYEFSKIRPNSRILIALRPNIVIFCRKYFLFFNESN